jgi:hypothetical protein
LRNGRRVEQGNGGGTLFHVQECVWDDNRIVVMKASVGGEQAGQHIWSGGTGADNARATRWDDDITGGAKGEGLIHRCGTVKANTCRSVRCAECESAGMVAHGDAVGSEPITAE